jgi:ATP-dependent DNA ligase
MEVLESTGRRLYCHAGDFYIDPWAEVERAVMAVRFPRMARWRKDKLARVAYTLETVRALMSGARVIISAGS